MITLHSGNILDSKTDILVNTVNCIGVMGKGLAKEFKKAFPAMFLEYSLNCQCGLLKPGTLHIFDAGNVLIINFPTKIHWKYPSKIEWVEQGLISLKEYLEENPLKSISIPALGCRNGGLDYTLVKSLIFTILGDLGNDIRLFEPKG